MIVQVPLANQLRIDYCDQYFWIKNEQIFIEKNWGLDSHHMSEENRKKRPKLSNIFPFHIQYGDGD